MASRRGAVKINPVTGKMEKTDSAPVAVRSGQPPWGNDSLAVPRPSTTMPPCVQGMHRDGSIMVSDKYVNAAKDMGLGGGGGTWDRMAIASGGYGAEPRRT
jgi:hypothetical protein